MAGRLSIGEEAPLVGNAIWVLSLWKSSRWGSASRIIRTLRLQGRRIAITKLLRWLDEQLRCCTVLLVGSFSLVWARWHARYTPLVFFFDQDWLHLGCSVSARSNPLLRYSSWLVLRFSAGHGSTLITLIQFFHFDLDWVPFDPGTLACPSTLVRLHTIVLAN